jgi:hypothetical protein
MYNLHLQFMQPHADLKNINSDGSLRLSTCIKMTPWRIRKKTQDYWVFGLCPSSGFLKNISEQNVLESDTVSETLCSLEYLTMDKVQKIQ